MKINLALFKNFHKTKETQPDFTGSFLGDDKKYKDVIAAWMRKTKNDSDYISLSIDLDNLDLYIKSKENQTVKPNISNLKPVQNEDDISPNDLPF